MSIKAQYEGLKIIGRGHFTTAYLKDDTTVILRSRDKVKEIMSMGSFPETELFPKIKQVGYRVEDEFSIYETDFVKVCGSLKRRLSNNWLRVYQQLRVLDKASYKNVFELREIVGDMTFREDIKEDLLGAIEALIDGGEDVVFEISPKNVGYTEDGKLILLDCFYYKSAIRGKR